MEQYTQSQRSRKWGGKRTRHTVKVHSSSKKFSVYAAVYSSKHTHKKKENRIQKKSKWLRGEVGKRANRIE